jgi:hypothetical protein
MRSEESNPDSYTQSEQLINDVYTVVVVSLVCMWFSHSFDFPDTLGP